MRYVLGLYYSVMLACGITERVLLIEIQCVVLVASVFSVGYGGGALDNHVAGSIRISARSVV